MLITVSFSWQIKTTSNYVSGSISRIFRLEWYPNHPKNLHVFPGALLAPVGGQLRAPCCGEPPKPISVNPEAGESASGASAGCRLLCSPLSTVAHASEGWSSTLAGEFFMQPCYKGLPGSNIFNFWFLTLSTQIHWSLLFWKAAFFAVKIFIRRNKSCRCSALTLPDLLFRCLIGGTCIWKCCPQELSSPSKSSLIGPDKSRLKYATCCGISWIRKI